jgi:hypothetical protein
MEYSTYIGFLTDELVAPSRDAGMVFIPVLGAVAPVLAALVLERKTVTKHLPHLFH